MKLDYLKDGSEDCPLVRLYDFRSEEVQQLRATFERLASGATERVAIDDVIPVQSVDGTRLTFSRGARARGVVECGQRSFEVVLTPEGWQRCSGLVEPFCEASWGYQWLCDDVGHIRLLLSHDGAW